MVGIMEKLEEALSADELRKSLGKAMEMFMAGELGKIEFNRIIALSKQANKAFSIAVKQRVMCHKCNEGRNLAPVSVPPICDDGQCDVCPQLLTCNPDGLQATA